jgi:hypothetical protein
MVLADDNVHRGLERRALRNTRSLVNSLEREADADRQLQRLATRVFVAAFLIGTIILAFALTSPGKTPAPPQILSFPERAVQLQNK